MRWRRADRARQWQIERLPDLLYFVARALRGGHTLHTALVAAADDPAVSGDALRRAVERVAVGVPVRDELDRWAAALHHRDADLVRAVLNAGSATGAALAGALDRAATSLRDRAELQREVAALTAQARASALLLTVAPFGFLAVVAAADPAVLSRSFASFGGRLAFFVGVVLDALGWFWMRRLADGVDP